MRFRHHLPAALVAVVLLLGACAAPESDPTDPPATTGGDGSAPPTAGGPPIEEDALLAMSLTDVRTGETFTLAELAAEKPVLVETMAIWCTTCKAQQREVVRAHESADFHSVGIDVDPNERPADLAEYADREGFDWRFVMADAELVSQMTDRWGFGVTNPPSTPTFIVTADGGIRALEFGRIRAADELVRELGAG